MTIRRPILVLLALAAFATTAVAQDDARPIVASPADTVGRAIADSAVYWYNTGNEAYRGGRFAEAATCYERAIATGGHNSAVAYNLGNAWYRLGRPGLAILNYERALAFDPANEDAARNLRFVSSIIADRIDEKSPEVLAQDTIRRALRGIPADFLAAGMLIGLAGACGILAWWLLGGPKTRGPVIAFLAAGALWVGSVTFAGVRLWASEAQYGAIVLARESEARFEPGARAKVAFVLHEGTRVWIERREEHWALVRTDNGLRGWVRDRDVERI